MAKESKDAAQGEVISVSEFPAETYPNVEGERSNLVAVLEMYRQSVIGGQPFSLEWLFDSLRDGDVKDLLGYSELARQAASDQEAAILAAGGPFDASYNPPPVLLGEEQENAQEDAPVEEAAEVVAEADPEA